jgi:serine protease Do
MKRILLIIAILVILVSFGQQSNILPSFNLNPRLPNLPSLPKANIPNINTEKQTVVYEESVITKVVDNALPSVVTIGITTKTSSQDNFELDPSNPFNPFRRTPSQRQQQDRNIGSGFIISQDGLIITNKHVVSTTDATYKVLTNDKKEYSVDKIYRDPLNDLAILKINASGLKPLQLGDSNSIKLGQLAIAIGTPLGEFTNTVTAGIVSGLGRGITAGSPFEGFVEKLDNVIQTDAAISPGNSGGPLLNSKGQVIGVNTAIAQEGQNIGFAIPANIVSELLKGFRERGESFERPIIGVRYQMVDQQNAILNEVVEGAYVVEVIKDSPADKAGIEEQDIITHIDGQRIKGNNENSEGLIGMISKKRVGDTVEITYWRDGQTRKANLTLEAGQ